MRALVHVVHVSGSDTLRNRFGQVMILRRSRSRSTAPGQMQNFVGLVSAHSLHISLPIVPVVLAAEERLQVTKGLYLNVAEKCKMRVREVNISSKFA